MIIKYAFIAIILSSSFAQAAATYWKANTNYPAQTQVVHNNTLWVAQKISNGISPSADSERIWLRIGVLNKPSNVPTIWNAAAAYSSSTIVSYAGELWQASTTNYNKTPNTESNDWIKQSITATAKIASTPIPTSANPIYWQAKTTYQANTTVTYNQTAWLARWYTQGEIPGSAGSAWVRVSSMTPGIPAQSNPTSTPQPIIMATSIPTPTSKPTLTPTPAGPTETPQTLNRIYHLNKPSQLSNSDLQTITREAIISTGLWVNKGDAVIISYYYQVSMPNIAPTIAIHDLNKETWDDQLDQKQDLSIGSNLLQATQSGLLYILSNNQPNTSEMVIEVISGGQ